MTLYDLCCISNEPIRTLISDEVYARIVESLCHSFEKVRSESLHLIGHLIVHEAFPIEHLSSNNIVEALAANISSVDCLRRRDTATLIIGRLVNSDGSNRFTEILVNHGCIPAMCELLSSGNPGVHRAAALALKRVRTDTACQFLPISCITTISFIHLFLGTVI